MKEFIMVLDTCSFSDLYNNRDIELLFYAIATESAFNTKQVITSYSFLEFFSGNYEEDEIKNRLLFLTEYTSGTLQLRGVTDKYVSYYDPRYWLQQSDFDLANFLSFINSTKFMLILELSRTLTNFTKLLINSIVYLNSREDSENVDLLRIIAILSLDEVTLLLNKFCAQSILKKQTVNNTEDLGSVIDKFFKLIDSELSTNYYGNYAQSKFDSKIAKKVRLLVKKQSKYNVNDLDKHISAESHTTFAESIYDLFKVNLKDTDILDHGVKFMYLNSPIYNGKIEYNDLIDLYNLMFLDSIKNVNIIYSTQDKKWIKFIEEYVDILPILSFADILKK